MTGKLWLNDLNRADLISLLEELAPADELKRRVNEILAEKPAKAEKWRQESADAIEAEGRWIEEHRHPLADFLRGRD